MLKVILGISYPEKALKKELWEIVKSVKSRHISYVIDKMAAQHGNIIHV